MTNSPEEAEILLKAGADPSLEDLSGHTALMYTASHNAPEVTRVLLAAAECDPNQQSKSGWTALLIAARDNSAQVADILLDHGADVELCHPATHKSPMVYAMETNNEDVAKMMNSYRLKKSTDKILH